MRTDKTGAKFGSWTLVKYIGSDKWLCKCDCGIEKYIDEYYLDNGKTYQCEICNERERNERIK